MTDFTRYMTPLGCGVAAHYSGLLYKREEVDPEIERLTAERDRYKARAERAEAGLRYYRDQMCEGFCTDLKSQAEYGESMDFHCAGCKARATLAQIDAGPAGWPECIHMTAEMARNCPTCNPEGFATTGAEERWCDAVENACLHCGGSGHKGDVSEPAGVKVKAEATVFPTRRELQSGNVEYAVDAKFSVNSKVTEHWSFEYDRKSLKDFQRARMVARFAASAFLHGANVALKPGQTHREGWEQAKKAAAERSEAMAAHRFEQGQEVGEDPHTGECASQKFWLNECAKAIRAMPYPGDSQ